MANPAPKPRPRGAERVRRVNAKRPPDVEVTLVGSSTAMTPTVAALIAELIELGRTGCEEMPPDAREPADWDASLLELYRERKSALLAAFAADKARAVEAAEDAAFIRGRDAVRKHPEGWGLVARPTPDEARRLVESYGRAVDRLASLDPRPTAGEVARLSDEHDTARAAILRALGVEA